MKKNVYGPVESINTGDMTVDDWQKQLVETWKNVLTTWNKVGPHENEQQR